MAHCRPLFGHTFNIPENKIGQRGAASHTVASMMPRQRIFFCKKKFLSFLKNKRKYFYRCKYTALYIAQIISIHKYARNLKTQKVYEIALNISIA